MPALSIIGTSGLATLSAFGGGGRARTGMRWLGTSPSALPSKRFPLGAIVARLGGGGGGATLSAVPATARLS